jgi:DNA-binding MarR family transcriptional regulator
MTESTTEDVQWLNSAENRAWVSLADLLFRLPSTLDSDLQRETNLSFYEYMVLAMLSETRNRTLGMGELAGLTSGSLSRLSHVVKRLEVAGFVTRTRSDHDKRHTNAHLTEAGWEKIVASAPSHVTKVREIVFDALTEEQVTQLAEITTAVRERLGSARLPGTCTEEDADCETA